MRAQRHIRVGEHEPREKVAREEAQHAPRHADLRAHLPLRRRLADVADNHLVFADVARRIARQRLPRRGQRHARAPAHKELNAQLVFQPVHRLDQTGHGDIELLRRGVEAARAAHQRKILDLLDVHAHLPRRAK